MLSDRGRSGSAALSLLLGPFAVLLGASTGGGRLRLRYPRDVAETVPTDAMVQTETLWEPGDEVVDIDPYRMTTSRSTNAAA